MDALLRLADFVTRLTAARHPTMTGYHFPCDGTNLPPPTIRSPMRQLFRYGLVGVASNAVAYGAYLLITAFGTSPKVSMTLVYVVGATVGFVGNRTLTFAHQGSLLGAGFRYVIAHSFGYLLNLSILIVMVDHLGYAHQVVQAFAILGVAAFLFVAFKFFVFTHDEVSPAQEQ